MAATNQRVHASIVEDMREFRGVHGAEATLAAWSRHSDCARALLRARASVPLPLARADFCVYARRGTRDGWGTPARWCAPTCARWTVERAVGGICIGLSWAVWLLLCSARGCALSALKRKCSARSCRSLYRTPFSPFWALPPVLTNSRILDFCSSGIRVGCYARVHAHGQTHRQGNRSCERTSMASAT
eukprot:SAG11_NODE_2529_length_3251_cov_2.339467_3_plen_188_part_00